MHKCVLPVMRRLCIAIAVLTSPVAAQTLTTLYSFPGGAHGANPESSVTLQSDGSLVGTTPYGGTNGFGTVYQLTPGTPWTQSPIHSFLGGADGANPQGGLTLGTGGVLYGTTSAGGSTGNGTVFQLTPPAVSGGAWTKTILYNFQGGADGSNPQGNLARLQNGFMYGTTAGGGTGTNCAGCGTVFAMIPPPKGVGSWSEKVIYTFNGGKDGSGPQNGVIVSSGKLYGTTCCGTVGGTVFRLTPVSGSWVKASLYGFAAYHIGAFPGSLAIDSNGVLYGTTTAGGASNAGIVFSLTPAASGKPYTLATIHSFTNGADGGAPYGGVTLGSNGVLYTTVTAGCQDSVGGVLEFTPPAGGTGSWTETVLHNFTGGSDGSQPFAGLVLASNTLYGTTVFGGTSVYYGTVFELVP